MKLIYFGTNFAARRVFIFFPAYHDLVQFWHYSRITALKWGTD